LGAISEDLAKAIIISDCLLCDPVPSSLQPRSFRRASIPGHLTCVGIFGVSAAAARRLQGICGASTETLSSMSTHHITLTASLPCLPCLPLPSAAGERERVHEKHRRRTRTDSDHRGTTHECGFIWEWAEGLHMVITFHVSKSAAALQFSPSTSTPQLLNSSTHLPQLQLLHPPLPPRCSVTALTDACKSSRQPPAIFIILPVGCETIGLLKHACTHTHSLPLATLRAGPRFPFELFVPTTST